MNVRESIRKIINEDNRMRRPIRKVVRDIITLIKQEGTGEFYLPEYFEEENSMVYEFIGLNPFSVEVIIEYGEYEVDAYFSRDNDTIIITIRYEKNEKNSILYDLVGELNEVVAHELRHIVQQKNNLYDLDVEEPESPLEYYSQPHEIDAQYFGFKRLSRLLKKPFDKVVRNWFDTHKEQHRLDDDEIEIVIDKILNHKK